MKASSTKRPVPPREDLERLLAYDQKTGKLFWKERSIDLFCCKRHYRTWNTRYAGKEAFTRTNVHGYRIGQLLGRPWFAHRVIWVLVTGTQPDEVDHINGDRTDNRWLNLRNCSRSENARNQKTYSGNKSGMRGVSLTPSGKWRVQISRGRSRKACIGTFETFEEAAAARQHAEQSLGFHSNHGRQGDEA